MTISKIIRNPVAAAAVLALMAAANGALASEKLVATDASVRTILAFKVPDAAALKLLPEGWQVSPPSRMRKKSVYWSQIWDKIRGAWRDVGNVRCAVGMSAARCCSVM